MWESELDYLKKKIFNSVTSRISDSVYVLVSYLLSIRPDIRPTRYSVHPYIRNPRQMHAFPWLPPRRIDNNMESKWYWRGGDSGCQLAKQYSTAIYQSLYFSLSLLFSVFIYYSPFCHYITDWLSWQSVPPTLFFSLYFLDYLLLHFK